MNQIFFFLFQIICILIYNDLMAIPGAFWFNAVPKVSNRPNPIWSHLWGGGGGSFRGNDRSKSPACTEKKMLDFLGEVFVGVVFGIVPSHVDGYLAFKNSA